MQPLPDKIKTPYVTYLRELRLPDDQINASLKWLQYYLDFCSKYHHPASAAASLPPFLKKLAEKKQSVAQRGAAEKAVKSFLQLVAERKQSTPPAKASAPSANSNQPATASKASQCKSGSWADEFNRLAEEIKLRHYSPKTLKSYRVWVSKFQAFVRSKEPPSLESQDAKSFITWLAVAWLIDSVFAIRLAVNMNPG